MLSSQEASPRSSQKSQEAPPGSSQKSEAAPPGSSQQIKSEEAPPGSSQIKSEAAPPGSSQQIMSEAAPPGSSQSSQQFMSEAAPSQNLMLPGSQSSTPLLTDKCFQELEAAALSGIMPAARSALGQRPPARVGRTDAPLVMQGKPAKLTPFTVVTKVSSCEFGSLQKSWQAHGP